MSRNQDEFSELYLAVRRNEERLYTDEEVAALPLVDRHHMHFKEWKSRQSSFNRLRDRLLLRNKSLNILDLCCGNGWLSNRLSAIHHSTITGVDSNRYEITQAQRIFPANHRLTFIEADIAEFIQFNKGQYDIIILASCIQYFISLRDLLGKLILFLNSGGEIHILDSPFYTEKNIEEAKNGSRKYYTRLGFPGMIHYYHHHTWQELAGLNIEIKNRGFIDRLVLKLTGSKNYFPWIIVKP